MTERLTGLPRRLGLFGHNFPQSTEVILVDHGLSLGAGLAVLGNDRLIGQNLNHAPLAEDSDFAPDMLGRDRVAAALKTEHRFVIDLARDLGYTVRERAIPRELLYIADEVFFTGTAAEVTPIRSIDKIPVGDGSRGKVTEVLQRAFFEVLSNERSDKHGWLTFVN